MKKFGLVAAFSLAVASTGAAAETKFAAFSIKTKKEAVSVTAILDGYSPSQIMGFIAEHCAGSVGDLVAKGKPRKKKGKIFQKYTTTCSGGPNRSIINDDSYAVQVEQLENGKTLYEYTYGIDGQILFDKRIR